MKLGTANLRVFFQEKLVRKKSSVLVLALLTLNLVLLAFWLTSIKPLPQDPVKSAKNFPEAKYLEGKNWSFQELSDYFTNLAYSKGAEYAFEVLKIAPVPPNTDMHLLGHLVGDVLYKQQGVDGIKVCTDDFRNACSHSIVIGLFSDEGEKALTKITQACNKAPGGKGAYNMCFHGLGHGILAAVGYDLEKTVEICQKTKSRANEAPECVGGAIMEIIGGGGHDRDLWSNQRQRYLKSEDPLYPCNSSLIPREAKGFCYTYLTPHFFNLVGADLGSPQPQDFEKAFRFCGQLSASEDADRRACYGGFGKEFVVLAKSRDVRNIENMSDEELQMVSHWCSLAGFQEAVAACLTSAVSSLYWGGENDQSVAVRFCGLIQDTERGAACFRELISAVSYYIDDLDYRRQFCREVPSTYTRECEEQLRL